jgi:hypothetical protein
MKHPVLKKCLFFYKSREREGKINPVFFWGGVYQWKGKVIRKGYRRVGNLVYKCM